MSREKERADKNAPAIKMESFTNQQEGLFSREECLASAGYILIRGIPVEIKD